MDGQATYTHKLKKRRELSLVDPKLAGRLIAGRSTGILFFLHAIEVNLLHVTTLLQATSQAIEHAGHIFIFHQ
jgi:hypothetical protein